MKTYNVGFWYTEYGSQNVEANSEEEAERILKTKLGNEGLSQSFDYDVNDRDYGTQDGEELK